MSKKAFFFVILFILIVVGVLGWYFFLRTGTLPTTPDQANTNSNGNLFPFGDNQSNNNNGNNSVGQLSSSTPIADTGEINDMTGLPRLRQISTVPAAGVVAFDLGSTTLIRYIERATGHIYETKSASREIKKISNVTIPKIYETLWASNGNRVVARYLKDENDTIKTFSAKISTTTGPEQAIEGTFLPDNIRDITISGNKLYYLNESVSGSNGITANLDGSGKVSAFASSFSDWTSRWTSTNGITIFSRPSAQVLGTAYLLNPSTGAYTKIGSSKNGLTALGNNDGTLFLLSYTEGNSVKTALYDTKTSKTEELGISTFTDKCIWSKKQNDIIYCAVPVLPPAGNYPDDWYKGKASLTDSLWRIDVTSGETKELVNPIYESSIPMDMIDLGLNQSESVIVFKNKKDQFVWRYEIK